jgi:hypothetical protein
VVDKLIPTQMLTAFIQAAKAQEGVNLTPAVADAYTSKTDNYDTYQVYTIVSGSTIYVGSEHLLFQGRRRRASRWAKWSNSR